MLEKIYGLIGSGLLNCPSSRSSHTVPRGARSLQNPHPLIPPSLKGTTRCAMQKLGLTRVPCRRGFSFAVRASEPCLLWISRSEVERGPRGQELCLTAAHGAAPGPRAPALMLPSVTCKEPGCGPAVQGLGLGPCQRAGQASTHRKSLNALSASVSPSIERAYNHMRLAEPFQLNS